MNDQPTSKQDPTSIRDLINGGAEVAGAAIGGALGFLAGGPVVAGAFAGGGAMAALALKRIGRDISERMLAPREKVRVGGVMAIAAAEIKRRLDAGETVRSDGFFEEKAGQRSDGDEVAEALLLKAQREPEEKKLPFMARLLSNIAFDATISVGMAHQLIKLAEALNYRQLCILRLAAMAGVLGLRQQSYRGQQSFDKSLYQLLYECMDLYHRGMINFGGSAALSLPDVAPAAMKLQGFGADLYNLMGLDQIPPQDFVPVAQQLGQ